MLNHANTNHIYGLKDKINKYAAEKRIKPQVVGFTVFNTTMTSRRIYSTWTIPYNNRISSNSLFKNVIKSVEAHEYNNEIYNEQLITLEKNKCCTLMFKMFIYLENNIIRGIEESFNINLFFIINFYHKKDVTIKISAAHIFIKISWLSTISFKQTFHLW